MIERLLMLVLRFKTIVRAGFAYLRRFYLTPRLWSRRVFLHHIMLPDPDPHPHDHPWPFTTIPLRGWYQEVVYERTLDGHLTGIRRLARTRWLRPAKREATHAHRIVCTSPGGAWTLVIAGRAMREWGFLTEAGWVPWYTYLGVPNEPAPEDRIPMTQGQIHAAFAAGKLTPKQAAEATLARKKS